MLLCNSICPAGREGGTYPYRMRTKRAYIEFRAQQEIYRVRHWRTYRQNKGVNQMTDNKNQLREDAIEFALLISDLCDELV